MKILRTFLVGIGMVACDWDYIKFRFRGPCIA